MNPITQKYALRSYDRRPRGNLKAPAAERYLSSHFVWHGDTAMVGYRIYTLDHAGHVVSGMDADCETDEAAFAFAATALGPGARAEIWQGTRRLGKVSESTQPLESDRAESNATGD